MYRTLPLVLLFVFGLALVPAFAEPVALALSPEVGLRVAYDIEAAGNVITRAASGQEAHAKVTVSLRRVDVVQSVTEERITVERTLSNIVIKQDGRVVPLEGVSTVHSKVEFDRQGQVLPNEDAGLDKLPLAVTQTLNLIEFVPFAPTAVENGDQWDASGIETEQPKGVKEEKSVSKAELIDTYESDGMQVALLQQAVESVFVQAAPEGTPSKGLRVTMKADVLQSNRIEDGCLLGVKGTLSMSMDLLDQNGKVILSNSIDGLHATAKVAAE
jgi:hypothetical protein